MKSFRQERGQSKHVQSVSPWKAVVQASRRDLYVLFLESERLAHQVVENLPEEGIRRVFGVPVDTDVVRIRARLAREIDEKRALLKPLRQGNQGMSLAQAAWHIADAWAESDAERRKPAAPGPGDHRPHGMYFRSGWKSVPGAQQPQA